MPVHFPKIITILIADDHPATILGIRSILEKALDIKIVGEVKDGLDLIMPHLSPAELEEWVRTNYPETITLVLTAHDRDAYLSAMIDAGAAGYLDKKLRAGQLISAIRRAAHGEFLFDKKQIERANRWKEEVTAKWESLSARERDVLQMLTEGMENKTIAYSLGITINTVEKHLDNIYKKLEVTSRTEAIHWWVEKITDFRN